MKQVFARIPYDCVLIPCCQLFRLSVFSYQLFHLLATPKLAASQADRIVVTPGQLTSYWAGALEIMALREQSQKALGDKFDLRAFHDEVLKDGAITLPMLREKIDQWLKAAPSVKP